MPPTAANSSAEDGASANSNASKDGLEPTRMPQGYTCQSLTLFINQSIIWRKLRLLCIISDVGWNICATALQEIDKLLVTSSSISYTNSGWGKKTYAYCQGVS